MLYFLSSATEEKENMAKMTQELHDNLHEKVLAAATSLWQNCLG